MKIKISLFGLMFLFLGCKEIVVLYPENKSQYITVINDFGKDERTIIVGKQKHLPDTNYVTLDISNVSQLGDCIHICWKD